MKFFVAAALLLGIGSASAESHPAWWRYASPESTALVGIQWERLRTSPFGEAIGGELTGQDGLGFPDLGCLKDARQILISSPALLAIASGNFPAETLRDQALRGGLKKTLYREFEIWVTPGKNTLSVTRIGDQLALVGKVKTLQDAIDRSLVEEAARAYSPLLARAARYAPYDLFVVAARLPDPLAEHFVPIETEADGFEGAVSLEGGLRMGALLNASSDEAAARLADELKKAILMLPPIAREIQVRVDQDTSQNNVLQNIVILTMAVNEQQLAAGLRPETPTVTEKQVAAATPVKIDPPKPEPAKPAGPQVIRIYGLDDGPREIVMR